MNKKIANVIFCLASILLSACAASSTATPPVPSPVPLAGINIGDALVAEGDLPAGVVGDQIRIVRPEDFSTSPGFANGAERDFVEGGQRIGSVYVLLYGVADDLGNAFTAVKSAMGGRVDATPAAGEMSASFSDKNIYQDYKAGIVFVRCHALVSIQFVSKRADIFDATIAYARRLDARLKSLVCG